MYVPTPDGGRSQSSEISDGTHYWTRKANRCHGCAESLRGVPLGRSKAVHIAFRYNTTARDRAVPLIWPYRP